METVIAILAVGQVITAGLLLSIILTLGKHRKAIDHLLESVKGLFILSTKSSEIFKLIAETIEKKKK